MASYEKMTVFFARIVIGWFLFYAGWSKLVTYFTAANDWTAAGFLKAAQGPFAGFYHSLAGSALVDYLNAYGLTLVGIALLLGILVRWSAFWGGVIMVMYYFASFPLEHAFIVDDHVIIFAMLLLLAALGAGRVWGLDKSIENSNLVKNNPWLLKLLG